LLILLVAKWIVKDIKTTHFASDPSLFTLEQMPQVTLVIKNDGGLNFNHRVSHISCHI
jgi:hypothetical protein